MVVMVLPHDVQRSWPAGVALRYVWWALGYVLAYGGEGVGYVRLFVTHIMAWHGITRGNPGAGVRCEGD